MTTNAEMVDVLRRRSYETYTSPWVDVSLGASDHTLALGGQFIGRSTCRAAVQMSAGSEWTQLPVVGRSETVVRFRFRSSVPVTRLRYQLDLDTGGAGTDPSVNSIALWAQR